VILLYWIVGGCIIFGVLFPLLEYLENSWN
jgi:hypothetical protein